MKKIAFDRKRNEENVRDLAELIDSCWHDYENDQAKEDLKKLYSYMVKIYTPCRYAECGIYELLEYNYYGRYLMRMGRMCMYLEAGVYWEVFDEIQKMFSGFVCNWKNNVSLQVKMMYNIIRILSVLGGEVMLNRADDEFSFEDNKKIIKKWKKEFKFLNKKMPEFDRANTEFKNQFFDLKSKDNYSESMKSIKMMLSYTEKVSCNKETLINYLIDIIGNDIKYDCLANVIYGKQESELFAFFPYKYFDENGEEKRLQKLEEGEVDFTKVCTFSIPWNEKRMSQNIANLLGKEFKYDEMNHFGTYYPQVNMCYVNNGRHSVAMGVKNNQGKIRVDVFDIESLFGKIYTDGVWWYSLYGNIQLEKVEDFRFGVLFELAQMKYNLEN